MKTFFMLALSVVFSGTIALAQKPLNGGFESWTNVDGTLYPNDWMISDTGEFKSGLIERSSDATQGNYALKLNSYPTTTAPYVEYYDSFINQTYPVNLEFKIKINNIANTFLEGAMITIYKYDSDNDYLSEQVIRIQENSGNGWFEVSRRVNLGETKFVLINILLADFTGGNMYAIIDELKFVNDKSSIAELSRPKITVYPNPAVNRLSVSAEMPISKVSFYDLSGKLMHTFESYSPFENYDISSLPSGMYNLSVKLRDDNEYYYLLVIQ